jgi:mutator protein MutT
MEKLAGNLILRNKQILLLYRKDEEYWEVPGGKVEEDESPTQAAVREAKEEIGVEIELKKPFYSGEFQKNEEIFLWHAYVSEIKNGEPDIQEDKFRELKWIEPGELDELDLAPNLEMVLPALRKI